MYFNKYKMNEIYIKKNVCKNEYKIYKLLQKLRYTFIPKLISYDESKQELITEKINNLCVSDMYGENFTDVPSDITQKIRIIVKTLYEDGFNYVDITGYNFIEDNDGKVWIIDFEHCFCKGSNKVMTNIEKRYIKFIENFIYGNIKNWNPDFT